MRHSISIWKLRFFIKFFSLSIIFIFSVLLSTSSLATESQSNSISTGTTFPLKLAFNSKSPKHFGRSNSVQKSKQEILKEREIQKQKQKVNTEYSNRMNELEEDKELPSKRNFGRLTGKIYGGPLIGTAIGSSIGSLNSKQGSGEKKNPLQRPERSPTKLK